MNFFQIQFENGKSLEIKAHDDEQGILRGSSLIKRWNQPSAQVFRTNPYNAEFRKHLATHINEDYDPTQPTLDKDPIIPYKEKATKKKTRKERIPGEKVASKTSGPRSNHLVPLKDLAERLAVEPGAIRRRLRSANIEKPAGGWGWTSWEDPTVKQIESWFGEG